MIRKFLEQRLGPKKPVESYDPVTLGPLFAPHNSSIDGGAVAFAVRASGRDRNIFELAGVDKSPQNIITLTANILRHSLEYSIPSAFNPDVMPDTDSELNSLDPTYIKFLLWDLERMINGKKLWLEEQNTSNPDSLPRHLMRSQGLAKIVVTQVLDTMTDEDGGYKEEEILAFAKENLGGVPPSHLPLGAFLHDITRYATQGSDHDTLVIELLEQLGVRDSIRQALHEPVPNDRVLRDVDDFDSGAQKISRLVDVFGKVVPRGEIGNVRLRTTLAEVVEHSRERQTLYIEREKGIPGSSWYMATNRNLAIYLANERRVLNSAISWFDKIGGIPLSNLLQAVNDDMDRFGIGDVYLNPYAPG